MPARHTKTEPDAERTKLKNVALFKDDDESSVPNTLPIEKITLPASQPRRYFAPDAMRSLEESIRIDGILQPLLVRPVGEKYELVAGERRYKAAQSLGLTEVPVTIREMSDEQAVSYALIENLQREDLNPIEEVEGILQLLTLKLETEREGVISLLNKMAKVKRGLADNVVREKEQLVQEVFRAIGRLNPESFRTHRLPLLNLPEDILSALRAGKIEYTKAKELSKLNLESQRQALLEEAIQQNLSLTQIRERIKELQPPTEEPPSLKSRIKEATTRLQKAQLWDNPKKEKALEKLLAQIEKLLSEK